NPFGDGSHTNPNTLNAVRGFATYDDRFTLWSFNVKADGPVYSLSGGEIKAAVGGEFRRETYSNRDAAFLSTPSLQPAPDNSRHRTVTALFAELVVPFVSAEHSVPGIQLLQLSLAGRSEHYSDFGSTTNPQIGLVWAPIPGVKVRSTYGRSF